MCVLFDAKHALLMHIRKFKNADPRFLPAIATEISAQEQRVLASGGSLLSKAKKKAH
jgi:hypothetical protein